MTRCGGEAATPCMPGQRCLTHGLWDALGDQIASFLDSVTLQEVLDGIPAAKQAARQRRAAVQPASDRPARRRRERANEPAAHISRLERHGAAAAARRGRPCSRRSTSSAIRPRRTPKGGGRAASSRMRASKSRRWSAPSRPRSSSPAAARKPTTPCWPRGWDAILLAGIEHDSVLAPARGFRRAARSICRSGATASCAARALAPAHATRRGGRALAVAADRQQRDGRRAAGRRGRPRWHASTGSPCTPMRCRRPAACPIDFARARRRLPDALRPQARRAEGRRRAGRPRAAPACPPSSPAAARSGGAAPAPRTSRPSPASARPPRRHGAILRNATQVRRAARPAGGAGARDHAGGGRHRRGGRAPPQHDEPGACRAPAPRRWSSPSISRASP